MSTFSRPGASVEITNESVRIDENPREIALELATRNIYHLIAFPGALVVLSLFLLFPQTRRDGIEILVIIGALLVSIWTYIQYKKRFGGVSDRREIPRDRIKHAEAYDERGFFSPRLVIVFEEDGNTLRRDLWILPFWWDEEEKFEQAKRVLSAEGIEVQTK